MGAWGAGAFDNDDAMDWVAELEGAEDEAVLVAAFEEIPEEAGEYLEAPDCSMAIAAAEVVAALRGKPADDLPEEVSAWVEKKAAPKQSVVALAKAALKRIAAESELQELWDESDSRDEWHGRIADLQKRLA